jgi:hypothetical protein
MSHLFEVPEPNLMELNLTEFTAVHNLVAMVTIQTINIASNIS